MHLDAGDDDIFAHIKVGGSGRGAPHVFENAFVDRVRELCQRNLLSTVALRQVAHHVLLEHDHLKIVRIRLDVDTLPF